MQTENVIAWELIDAGASACWKIHYGPPCPCPSEGVKEKYMARMNRDRRNQISSLRSCTDKGRTNQNEGPGISEDLFLYWHLYAMR